MENANRNRSLATVGTVVSAAVVGALVLTATPVAQPVAQATDESTPVFANVFAQVSAPATSTPELSDGTVLPMETFDVSAGFGHSTGVHAGRSHAGVDMTGPSGAKILSATDGKVIQAGSSGGYGNLVTVKTETGEKVLYAHLSKINVEKGDQVTAGQTLGKQGSTGHSTGPHLHFEVRNKKDKPINPIQFLGLDRKELVQLGK